MGVAHDLINIKATGYKAKLYDHYGLAKGMNNIMSLGFNEKTHMSAMCRAYAMDLISTKKTIKKWNYLFTTNPKNYAE